MAGLLGIVALVVFLNTIFLARISLRLFVVELALGIEDIERWGGPRKPARGDARG